MNYQSKLFWEKKSRGESHRFFFSQNNYLAIYVRCFPGFDPKCHVLVTHGCFYGNKDTIKAIQYKIGS